MLPNIDVMLSIRWLQELGSCQLCIPTLEFPPVRRFSFLAALTVAAATQFCGADASAEVTLLSDNFNTAASSANYTEAATADAAVAYGFNYGAALGIPVAPKTTDGSTTGVRFSANETAGAANGITLHTIQSFSGDYTVRFDAWINANGAFPGGGTGSTEFLTAGVGGDGTTVNQGGATGFGAWTAVTGEGGSSRDYRIYKGSAEQFPASGQFSGGANGNNSDAYYSGLGGVDVGALPQGGGAQTGTTAVGTFGFEWHEVELNVENGLMNWSIDGLNIATLNPNIGDPFSTDGSVTLGYKDIFSSLSDSSTHSFGLIDNLSVTSAIPEPSSALALTALGAFGFVKRRRRTRA